MPEPVSTTIGICWLGYAAAQGYSRRNSAVSPEAQVVRDAVSAVVEMSERSQALFGGKAVALSQLRALANECGEAAWDGEDACAINPLAMFVAETFIRALPNGIPLPEFAPEPDGSISLDWIESRNRLLTASVGAGDRLAYAWIDGADKGHAVAHFDGENIPPLLLEGIKEITNHGHARLRAA
jgi:hypothetical protein